MKHVKKSVLLWYSAAEMMQLVADVPSYPKFLPWCARGDVLARDETGMTARLHLAYAGLKHAFTTRNDVVADEQLTMRLIDGPFSQLDGVWRFTPLTDGVATEVDQPLAVQGCRVDFDLRYAFASKALEAVVSPVFDRIAATLVDSFVKRAEAVHGPR